MPDLTRARQVAESVVWYLFRDDLIPENLIPTLALAIVQATPDLNAASVDEMSTIFDSLCAAMIERNAEKLHGVN